MFDTLAEARELTAGGVRREQAEAIVAAIRRGVDRGDHVTREQFRSGLAELRTEMAKVEARIIRWMIGTVIATAGLTVALLRLFEGG